MAISAELAEEFRAAPLLWHNQPSQVPITKPHLAVPQIKVEASLRDPLSGQRLARISMLLTENGSDNLFGERKIVQSFELLDGDISHAWATGAILLMCPNNGIARYIKIVAHPASHGTTGMLRID